MLVQIWNIQKDAAGNPVTDPNTGLEIRTLVSEYTTEDPLPDPLQQVIALLQDKPDAVKKLYDLLNN